jgi:GntR family transcriptional regulator
MATTENSSRYVQLAEELRRRISSGEYAAGTTLPSEPELAAAEGMSRTSVRNALKLLRGWGLVRVERGNGTFVRGPRPMVRRHATERYLFEKEQVKRPEYERRVDGALEQDTGLSMSDSQFAAEFDPVPATDDLAQVFGVPKGTKLLRRRHIQTDRATGGLPIRTGAAYLLYSDAERNPDLLRPELEPWPGGTQHQLFTIGIELDRIIDKVTARPPTPDEARELGIDEGVSVLVIRKISVDTKDRVVEVADFVLPGDRTELQYTIRLPRWGA